MISIGVDPGKSGAVAAIDEQGDVAFQKLDATEADINAFFLRFTDATIAFALIEKVHSYPKQGVASTFAFGRNYGFVRGLLIAHRIPFEEVSPMKWQREMACLSNGDKNITKARAQQLFPKLKIIHATADALLIAEFNRRSYGRKDAQAEFDLSSI